MRRRVTSAVAFGLVVVCASSVAAAVSARITGTSGDDVIRGTAGADTILGRGGDDRISALAGNDRITPGAGRDTVACGAGVDRVQADAADNVSGDCEVVAGAVPKPRLVLLGHPVHVQLAFPFADEFNTVLNRAAKPRDIVLFVLGAKDWTDASDEDAGRRAQGRAVRRLGHIRRRYGRRGPRAPPACDSRNARVAARESDSWLVHDARHSPRRSEPATPVSRAVVESTA